MSRARKSFEVIARNQLELKPKTSRETGFAESSGITNADCGAGERAAMTRGSLVRISGSWDHAEMHSSGRASAARLMIGDCDVQMRWTEEKKEAVRIGFVRGLSETPHHCTGPPHLLPKLLPVRSRPASWVGRSGLVPENFVAAYWNGRAWADEMYGRMKIHVTDRAWVATMMSSMNTAFLHPRHWLPAGAHRQSMERDVAQATALD